MVLTIFLSTPSARRATDHMDDETEASKISIHALREEGDRRSMTSPGIPLNFYPRPPRGGRLRLLSSSWIWPAISIHALREEGDETNKAFNKAVLEFLSTPSARRATLLGTAALIQPKISIHALREEGDLSTPLHSVGISHFYPRPPRGGRPLPFRRPDQCSQFLSTPSARRATK